MKTQLLENVPLGLLNLLRRSKRAIESGMYRPKDSQEIFSDIYRKGHWKKAASEQSPNAASGIISGANPHDSAFISGMGSSRTEIVGPYVQTVKTYLEEIAKAEDHPLTLVDLGCGDFQVSRAFTESVARYIGTDIVPDVVEYNQTQYGSDTVEFRHLNIIEGDLPTGDIALIRQVLQHLSNAQILKILSKLTQYKTIFVTEHQPSDQADMIPNKDWIPGRGIRLLENSGVFLDCPPFDSLGYHIEKVLEVPGHPIGFGIDPGVIRTYKLQGV